MNSNLRRVLSVALMLTVLAVNLVIPVSAADITISYADSPKSGQGGQGIDFYDTTVAGSAGAATNDGLDATSGLDTSYTPLEVKTSDNTLQWKATEWVCYPITVAVAGYYSIAMTYKVTGSPDVYIRTDDAVTKIKLTRKTSISTVSNLGYIWLDAGANNVYLDHNAGSTPLISFQTMVLTKVDSLPEGTHMTWLTPAIESTEKTSYDNTGSTNTVNVATGETLTFSVELPASAKYKVSVHGISNGENTVTATIGSNSQSATVADSAGEVATTEIGVLPISGGVQTLTLSGMTNYQLGWIEFVYDSEFISGIVGTTPADGASVSRGTDNFVIHSTDAMDPNATMTATITDGVNEIANVVEVDGTNVIVSFTETLDYSKTYTITVSGLKALNESEAMEDKVYTFSTDSASNTAGTATIGNLEVSVVGETVTVTGNVLGSTGKGIQGRNISLSNGLSATSGIDGAFTLTFTLPAGTPAGTTTYQLNTEYLATAQDVRVAYLPAGQETVVFDELKGKATAGEVKTVLDDYCEVLGVATYATDLTSANGITTPDYFYNYFLEDSFEEVDTKEEFVAFYKQALLMEQLNQMVTAGNAGITAFTGYITDNLATLQQIDEIQQNAFALVASDKWGTIASKCINAGVKTTPADAYAKFNQAVEETLGGAYGITAPSVQLTSADGLKTPVTNVFVNGTMSVPMSFNAGQKYLSGLELTIAGTNQNDPSADVSALFTKAYVSNTPAKNVVVTPGSNQAIFTIAFESSAKEADANIGTIVLEGYAAGTYDFTVSGTLTYLFTDGVNSYSMQVPVATPTPTFSGVVSPIVTTERDPATVNPGGGGGGGGSVEPPKKEEAKEEEEKPTSAYHFDDMESALWAQDMVHSLVGRGVISQSADRNFRPQDNVTREEFVKMLVTVVGSHNETATSTLSDVSANHWATSYIATAQNLGIVNGNADGSFGLGTNITRQDMAVMIFRTFEALGIDLTAGNAQFADATEIANYAQKAVSALEKQGIINGMGDNTFAPVANATRAQAAKVIYVMMEVLGV